MDKKELTYNEIKGVFERLFISCLSDEEYNVFANLTDKQMMSMRELALHCKKYEDAYKKSTRKLSWEFNHARQERGLREEFTKKLKIIAKEKSLKNCDVFTNNFQTKESLENISKSLQEEHSKALRRCSNKINACRWIRYGETINVKDLLLTRGFFYIGEYFKIPQSYRESKVSFDYKHQQCYELNKNYKLFKIFGPVIQSDLPISQEDLIIVPFSSYYDMHPTHRYEYLEWLAGHKTISDISHETFLFYLFGIQLRMFIDDSTTPQDRLDIVNHLVILYEQCREADVECYELIDCIDVAISKLFICNLEELAPKELFPQRSLILSTQGNCSQVNNNIDRIKETISNGIIAIINDDNSIPKALLTNYFYSRFAYMIESHIYIETWKQLLYVSNSTNCYYHNVGGYCINRVKPYSMLRYDYIFSHKLCSIFFNSGILFNCVEKCYTIVANQLKDYHSLFSVSHLLALFALPPSFFRLSDYKEVSFVEEYLRNKTEGHDYTIININDVLFF